VTLLLGVLKAVRSRAPKGQRELKTKKSKDAKPKRSNKKGQDDLEDDDDDDEDEDHGDDEDCAESGGGGAVDTSDLDGHGDPALAPVT